MRFDKYDLTDASGKELIKLFHSTVPTGKRAYREHYHTQCEIGIFLRGEGIYRVRSTDHPFRAGDIFLFGSDEPHCIIEIHSEFDLLNVQFEPRLLWSGQSAALPLLALFTHRSSRFSNRIDPDHPATARLREMLLAMQEEFKGDRAGRELKIRTLLFEILLTLLREYGYTRSTDTAAPRDRTLQQLRRAMDYMDQNLSEELSLEDIARRATMSRTYFSTVFKKYNGITPWEYVTIKRVEAAIRLLETTEMNTLDIAQTVGLGSPANFYKAFERVTGKTPGAYKSKNHS